MNTKNEPIRCFEGNTQPHEPFWTWKNEDGKEPELDFDGYISEWSWWDDDITPGKFKADLEKYGQGGPITIRLNSYGGDVIAASKINSYIRDYPGKVTVQIDSIAASAATVVALAGDVIRMQEAAYFMIHDPLFVVFLAALNIEDLARLSTSLQAIKEGIVNVYETKTGLSRNRLAKLMTEETWMDAQKALDLGFIDDVLRAGKKEFNLPNNVAAVNALRNYTNVPPELHEALTKPVPPAAASSEQLLTEDMQHEAQTLDARVQQILNKE